MKIFRFNFARNLEWMSREGVLFPFLWEDLFKEMEKAYTLQVPLGTLVNNDSALSRNMCPHIDDLDAQTRNDGAQPKSSPMTIAGI